MIERQDHVARTRTDGVDKRRNGDNSERKMKNEMINSTHFCDGGSFVVLLG